MSDDDLRAIILLVAIVVGIVCAYLIGRHQGGTATLHDIEHCRLVITGLSHCGR